MKINVCLIVIVSLFILFSCNRNDNKVEQFKEIHYKQFPKTIELNKHNIVKSINQLMPGKLFTVDSLFIVWEYQGSKYFFHVYDEKFNFLGSFGKKGNGPGEYTMPEFCGQYEKDNIGNIKLWIHDQNIFKAFKIDLAKAINAEDDKFIEDIAFLPTIVLTIPQLLVINKGELFFGRSDMVSEGRFFKFRKNDENIKWTEKIPNVDEFTAPENLDLAYHSIIKYDSVNDRIISIMTHFERIDFYNNQGILCKSIVRDNGNPDPDFRSVDKPFKDNNYTYYYDLQVTNKYIFASYSGLSRGKIKLLKETNKQQKGYIHVFDLDGNPLVEFVFNHNVSKFAIDKNINKLYIINYDSENIPILEYNLPKIL